jgi:hypothetical protein
VGVEELEHELLAPIPETWTMRRSA